MNRRALFRFLALAPAALPLAVKAAMADNPVTVTITADVEPLLASIKQVQDGLFKYSIGCDPGSIIESVIDGQKELLRCVSFFEDRDHVEVVAELAEHDL